jgi:hypothetical protein
MKRLFIRRLRSENAQAYRAVLVEGLILHPDRFVEDYRAEVARPLTDIEADLEQNGMFGAWVDEKLVPFRKPVVLIGSALNLDQVADPSVPKLGDQRHANDFLLFSSSVFQNADHGNGGEQTQTDEIRPEVEVVDTVMHGFGTQVCCVEPIVPVSWVDFS